MQKRIIINFYETWKSLIDPLTNVDFQRRSWFRHEGNEVSTFEESIGNVRQFYLDDLEDDELYQDEFGDLMKELYEKLTDYVTDDNSIFNSAFEDRLLNDPKWLSIVALAQNIYNNLDDRIEKLKSEGKSGVE